MNNSSLFDEKTFYQAFLRDLTLCKKEVIIESPFIAMERMKTFHDIFENLLKRGVSVYIITRNPQEHMNEYEKQSEVV